ncbi:MAG: hypothetical protein V1720_14780 [bacterium]
MPGDNFNLFHTLLKIKSYLLSLIEDAEAGKSFFYTEEYLDRFYPDKKEEVIDLLQLHGITSDSEIAFDDRVHFKFQKMVKKVQPHIDLKDLLHNFEIELVEPGKKEDDLNRIKTDRSERLRRILELLFKLAKNWAMHQEIESRVEDYSKLDEEELIRPDEKRNLEQLGSSSTLSFNLISELTTNYIEMLTDYYFRYGGDLSLVEFLEHIDYIKKEVKTKYIDLFKRHGLDESKLK